MKTKQNDYFSEGKLDERDFGARINHIQIVHEVDYELRHRFRIFSIHGHFGNKQNLEQQSVERVLAERMIHQDLTDDALRIHHIVAHRDQNRLILNRFRNKIPWRVRTSFDKRDSDCR